MSTQQPLVAVLQGGPSAEAEVSRVSAQEVSAGLAKRYRTALVELDKYVAQTLLQLQPDVVFPALHGPPGEDGTVQGLLELMHLPYVGSDVHGSAVAMDKAVAKSLFRRARLPVAPDTVIHPETELKHAVELVRTQLGDRVVIKPRSEGSALGVTLIQNGGDLEPGLAQALSYQRGAIVEPFILGRELTVGVLDTHGNDPQVFPVIEVITADDEWYDYTNRYAAGKSQHLMPAELPEELTERLQTIALEAHQCLGLRDLSRADFLLPDSGELALLEVNTLPGMTPTSLYPDGATGLGYSFEDLVCALAASALSRGST